MVLESRNKKWIYCSKNNYGHIYMNIFFLSFENGHNKLKVQKFSIPSFPGNLETSQIFRHYKIKPLAIFLENLYKFKNVEF